MTWKHISHNMRRSYLQTLRIFYGYLTWFIVLYLYSWRGNPQSSLTNLSTSLQLSLFLTPHLTVWSSASLLRFLVYLFLASISDAGCSLPEKIKPKDARTGCFLFHPQPSLLLTHLAFLYFLSLDPILFSCSLSVSFGPHFSTTSSLWNFSLVWKWAQGSPLNSILT